VYIPIEMTATFVDLELGRRWADYAENEPLPEILFGIKILKPVIPEKKEPKPPTDLLGWQTVGPKRNRIVSFSREKNSPRRGAWIHGQHLKV
jgi:hypothetical protein